MGEGGGGKAESRARVPCINGPTNKRENLRAGLSRCCSSYRVSIELPRVTRRPRLKLFA